MCVSMTFNCQLLFQSTIINSICKKILTPVEICICILSPSFVVLSNVQAKKCFFLKKLVINNLGIIINKIVIFVDIKQCFFRTMQLYTYTEFIFEHTSLLFSQLQIHSKQQQSELAGTLYILTTWSLR